MNITHLDGAGLRGALIAASRYVQHNRAELNRINVFPVPDGDTGTNLALTVSAVADRMRSSRTDSIGVVAREAAEAAVVGARGNCGMILSHFLLGFSEGVGERTRLSVKEFGDVLGTATEHVYRALERPMEGTMITIMRAISEESERLHASDYVVLFDRLLVRAREALASTPDLLPVLKNAGVVDAGARGFVHILEGITAFISGDPLVALEETPEFAPEPSPAVRMEYPAENEVYRYCTEALVRGPDLPDSDAVRGLLRERGDSLVVIRTGELLKIHIHTDEPEEVFTYLRGLGELATHKAEDMQSQHEHMERAAGKGHHPLVRRPVSVVADTACDLPEEVVRAHGIRLVPLSLVFEDEVLRDRVDITAEEFVERLRQGAHPGTSQPPPAAFSDAFRRAGEEGEEIVAVLLSSGLSGTYASARAASQDRGESDAPVTLVDSRGGSLLQGLMALKASELGELGWSADRIAAELHRIRERSSILVTLDTFERALASGRVGRGRAWLGTLLDIKPILEVERSGKLVPIAKARGSRSAFDKMLEIVDSRVPRDVGKVRFGVVHVGCPEVAREVAAEIRTRWGEQREVMIAPMSPIIATHAGERAWGIVFLVED